MAEEPEATTESAGESTVEAPADAAGETGGTLDLLLDVPLRVTVELGGARLTIRELLQLGHGSVIELNKPGGDPLDVFVNGKPIARGEAVIVNDKFGVRLTEVVSQSARVENLG
jgi:flagellar motor switch protein FliN/FliY